MFYGIFTRNNKKSAWMLNSVFYTQEMALQAADDLIKHAQKVDRNNFKVNIKEFYSILNIPQFISNISEEEIKFH